MGMHRGPNCWRAQQWRHRHRLAYQACRLAMKSKNGFQKADMADEAGRQSQLWTSLLASGMVQCAQALDSCTLHTAADSSPHPICCVMLCQACHRPDLLHENSSIAGISAFCTALASSAAAARHTLQLSLTSSAGVGPVLRGHSLLQPLLQLLLFLVLRCQQRLAKACQPYLFGTQGRCHSWSSAPLHRLSLQIQRTLLQSAQSRA